MTIAPLAAAPVLVAGALRFRPLAVPSRGSKELSVWSVDLPAGASSGEHSLDREQIVVVNLGVVTLIIGAEHTTAASGDALILPANTPLELRNDGPAIASATVISPVGFKATVGGRTASPPWSL